MKKIITTIFSTISFFIVCSQPTDFIGYWPLSGSADDQSGNGHNGTVFDAILSNNIFNNPNESYLFDANDRIEILNDTDFNFGTSDFSISLWFRSDNAGAFSLISKQSAPSDFKGWNIFYNSGKISFSAGDLSNRVIIESTGNYKDEYWHHVVAARTGVDANDWKLYIDGQSDATIVANNLIDSNITTTAPMYIGRRGAGNSFHGYLDEISIYNRMLLPTEIHSLYNGQTSTVVTEGSLSPIGHWAFSGNAEDQSGNGHSGTVFDAVLSNDEFERPNNAYLFDTNDRIEIDNDSKFNFGISDFSISIWFKTTSVGGSSLVSKQSAPIEYQGWNIWCGNGKVAMACGRLSKSGHVESNGQYNDGNWHHLVAIRQGSDANNWLLYIDGQSDQTTVSNNMTDPYIITTAPMYIGRRGAGDSFNGSLDELSIYNRALSSAEVQLIYTHQPLELWQEKSASIYFNGGNVGIGTDTPISKLTVDGEIRATKVKVLSDISVPDYVFSKEYDLRTLKETEEYIIDNSHLPEIPSANEIGTNGFDLGEMNMSLLKKIEELTLHMIELNKRILIIEKENKLLKNELKE